LTWSQELSLTYQLVALDLDGTVMDRDLVIPPAVRAAIGAAQARGIHVTLATGRMFGAALPFASALGIRTPLICYQGALIRDPLNGAVLEHTGMPGEEAAEAATALLAADIFVIAYVEERLCIAERRAELDYYLQFHPEGAEIVVAPDLPAMLRDAPPTKLLFVAEPAVVERELARLSLRFAHRLVVTRSHEHFGELTAPGISKGVALAHLAAHLGIPRERVVAIGDQENDLPMIEWAGLGLAMGNAIPAVKKAAAAILPSVQDAGVADGLRRFVLAESPTTTSP
jgi:Cof subfamily protein (haloacid dehalogenase superfamily)